MSSITWKIKKRAVNSKALFDEVNEIVEEGFGDVDLIWSSDIHRDSFIDLIDEWLWETSEEGKITQWKIVCDFRNNTIKQMEQGIYQLDVSYRQTDCLNTTTLEYTITALDPTEPDNIMEFGI